MFVTLYSKNVFAYIVLLFIILVYLLLEISVVTLKLKMNVQRSHHLQYHDWGEDLSKAPNPQLLPGRRSIKWLPLLGVVCVWCSTTGVLHLDGLNAEHNSEYGVKYLPHITSKLKKLKTLFQETYGFSLS